MPRFEAYVNLMTHGVAIHDGAYSATTSSSKIIPMDDDNNNKNNSPNSFLPLGAFSPMGRSQPAYLDQLLDMDAEGIARQAAKDAMEILKGDEFSSSRRQQQHTSNTQHRI